MTWYHVRNTQAVFNWIVAQSLKVAILFPCFIIAGIFIFLMIRNLRKGEKREWTFFREDDL